MNINAKIKALEEEIGILKDMQHNEGMKGAAKPIQQRLKREATVPELRFMEVAKKLCLRLDFQERVDIKKGNRIKKFYFPDFIDKKNKLIFEIDGGYHFSEEQRQKDNKRTLALNRKGFKVFRITNEEVMAGGTSAFLYRCYLSVGINIIEYKKSILKSREKYGLQK